MLLELALDSPAVVELDEVEEWKVELTEVEVNFF